MRTSKGEIERWVKSAKRKKKCTHLMIVCDTFSYEDYPIEVMKGDDITELIYKYNNYDTMSKIMEIYSMKRSIARQLKETRAWHPNHK